MLQKPNHLTLHTCGARILRISGEEIRGACSLPSNVMYMYNDDCCGRIYEDSPSESCLPSWMIVQRGDNYQYDVMYVCVLLCVVLRMEQ